VCRPSQARIYDCYLGGTAYFQADRNAVDHILELVPEIRVGVPGTAVIEADLRNPSRLFDAREAGQLIDWSQPAGLLIVAVTQFIPDADDP
jgi:S-adenosyl methyltransferase